MEQNQEPKHLCKFCNKSYPCGRSLGGHMRSHSTETTDEKTCKKDVMFSNNSGGNDTKIGIGYELRENPKKSWRLEVSGEKNSAHDKLCKHCGKTFPSWKSLFGHMKCHSDSERVSKSLEDQYCCNSSKQKMAVLDSQSAAPNRKKMSKRRARCMIATSNSFSLSSVNSESNHEQEEIVALSLIMLSRDARCWDDLNSFAESSDNNFLLKDSVCTTVETVKSRKHVARNLGHVDLSSESVILEEKQSEFRDTKNLNKSSRIVKLELSIDGSHRQLGKNLVGETESREAQVGSFKYGSGKKEVDDASDTTFKLEFAKKSVLADVTDAEIDGTSHKRSKFECSICNKVFHCYQALGGHKASHNKLKGCFNKLKGCFSPNIEVSGKSPEVQVSTDLTADGKHIVSCNYEHPIENHVASICEDSAETSLEFKNIGAHMCSICLKVFPSGQALGGHKRSHLVGNSETKNTQQGMEIQNPVPETREFLDLILPATIVNTNNVFKPCMNHS